MLFYPSKHIFFYLYIHDTLTKSVKLSAVNLILTIILVDNVKLIGKQFMVIYCVVYMILDLFL